MIFTAPIQHSHEIRLFLSRHSIRYKIFSAVTIAEYTIADIAEKHLTFLQTKFSITIPINTVPDTYHFTNFMVNLKKKMIFKIKIPVILTFSLQAQSSLQERVLFLLFSSWIRIRILHADPDTESPL